MTDRETMSLALDALEDSMYPQKKQFNAIVALKQALAQPEQAPKLSDAGADTNISRGLEPKGSGMVALNQPEQKPVAYLCENAIGYKYFRKKKPDNVYKPIALYTAPIKRPWLGLTSEDWENTPTSDKQGCERDAEMFDWVEQTLKDKNDVI